MCLYIKTGDQTKKKVNEGPKTNAHSSIQAIFYVNLSHLYIINEPLQYIKCKTAQKVEQQEECTL